MKKEIRFLILSDINDYYTVSNRIKINNDSKFNILMMENNIPEGIMLKSTLLKQMSLHGILFDLSEI